VTQAPASRWYFGWNIVAAATLLTLLTVGLRMSIGPFFVPMATSLGMSRSELASIVAIGMLFYGAGMPLAGYLAARYSTRFVLLTGTAIVVASILWTVAARTPLSLLLSFGVLMSLGLAFTGQVALTPVISRWFTRQRGMALFLVSSGSMAGIAVLTPLFSFAIRTVGWQNTLLAFGAVLAMATVPAALFIIRDEAPEHTDLLPGQIAAATARATPALGMTLGQAVRTAPFWKVAAGLFACGFSMNLLGTHGVPMLMDHGFDATTAAFGIGLIGAVAIAGTQMLARVADKLPRKNILATIYFVRGLGFFALLMVGTHAELYTAAAIGGLVWAGSVALSSAIIADVYGVRLVGVLYGYAYMVHQIGAMMSAWLGGWGYEHFGSHWIAFGAAGVLLLLAAAVSLRLPQKGYQLPGAPIVARILVDS
jgi:MFS family permease